LTSGFRGRKLGSLSGPPLGVQAPGAPEEVAEVLRYFVPVAHGVFARDSLGPPVSFCFSLTCPWVRLRRLGSLNVSVPPRDFSFIPLIIRGSPCVSVGASGAMIPFVGFRRFPCLSVVVLASLWDSVCRRVSVVVSLGLCVSRLVSVSFGGQLWVSVGVCLTSCGCPCASVCASGSPCVSPRLSVS